MQCAQSCLWHISQEECALSTVRASLSLQGLTVFRSIDTCSSMAAKVKMVI